MSSCDRKNEASAFIDSEHITVNESPWVAGPNGATLTGAGVGLAWAGPHQWTAKTSLAARIGAVPSLITDPSSVRLWLELNRAF